MPSPLTSNQVDFLAQRGVKVNVGDIYDEQSGNIIPANGPTVPEPPQATETTTGIGAALRGAGKAILPTLGGIATGAAAAAPFGLASGPLAEIGVPVAALIGGIGGAFGTSALQEKGLNYVAKTAPEGSISKLQKLSALDAEQHPYAQLGGSFIPGLGIGGLSRAGNIRAPLSAGHAAVGAGVMGGLDVGQQVMSGQPFDPTRTLLSTAGGAVTGGLVPGGRTSAIPPEDLAAGAAKAGKLPPSGPAPIDIEPLVGMSSKDLFTLASTLKGQQGAAVRAMATMKQHLGDLATPDQFTTLANAAPASLSGKLGDIMMKGYPEVAKAAAENKLEAPALAAGDKAEQEAAANRATTQARVEASNAATQQNPVEQPKSAAESAQVIAAAEPVDLDAAISAHDVEQKRLNAIETKMEGYQEGTPERAAAINYVNRARQTADEALRNAFAKAGTPEAPAGVGVEEAVNPRVLGEIKPPKEPKAPETPPETPPGTPPAGPAPAPLVKEVTKGKATFEDLLGRNVGGSQPPSEPPAAPPAAPVAPTAPVAPPAPPTKAEELGVAAQPGQQPKAPIGDKEFFINALGEYGSEGQRARKLLTSYPAMKDVPIKSIDDLRQNFSKILPGDQERLVQLYKDKAEGYVAKSGPRPLKMPKIAAKVPVEEAPTGPTGMVNGVTFTKIAEGWKNPQGKVVMSKSILDKLNAAAPETTPQEGGQSGAKPESFRRGTGEDAQGGEEAIGVLEDEGQRATRNEKNIRNMLSKGAAPDDVRSSLDANQLGKRETEKLLREYTKVKPPVIEPPTESRNFGPGEAIDQILKDIKAAAEKHPAAVLGAEEGSKVLPKPGPGAIGIKPSSVNPLEHNPLTFLHKSEHGLVPSWDIAEKAHPELGPRFTKGLNQTYIDEVSMNNKTQEPYAKLFKGTSTADQEAIGKYNYDRKYGNPLDPISPKNKAIADKAQAMLQDVTNHPDAPYVSEVKNGKLVERPREEVPNFWPEMIGRKEGNVLRGEPTPEQKALKEAQINHIFEQGKGSYEDAVAEYNKKNAPNPLEEAGASPEFAGLRRPVGKGLAPELQEKNALQLGLRYLGRVNHDIALSKNIEQDPQLAKGLNLPTNGKGEATPEVVLDDKGNPIEPGVLAGNAGVRTAMHEYTQKYDAETREFEHLRNLGTATQVGPYGRARHGMIAGNNLRRVMGFSGNIHYLQALDNLFADYSGAKKQALEGGSMRYARNINPTMANDMLEGTAKAIDRLHGMFGANKVAEASMVHLDNTARLFVKSRIAAGDTKFLDKFGPNDWRTKGSVDDIVNYITADLVRTSWGTFTGKDTPHFLVGPEVTKGWGPVLALSRSPIGTFNTFMKDVYTPATKGNIKPLLHTALGALVTAGTLETLKEAITKRKPPELTWAEYLHLGGKDTAETVFSKLATAGYAGIASHLALSATQFFNHEPTQAFNSMVYVAEENILNRLSQFVHAWSKGETDLTGLGTVGLSLAKDQIQLVRQATMTPDRGFRDERIARRLGYMPQNDEPATVTPSNPFSLNQALLRGDTNLASRIMSQKIATGNKPALPSSEVRTEHMRGPNGEILNYYKFIEDSQGKAAAEAAKARDIENTIKKRQVFSSALANRK